MKPNKDTLRLLMGFVLALAFTLSGFCQPIGGNDSKPQGRTSVLRIDEGYVGAQGVFIYYKSFGSGPPLLILHGGPGASHDYFLPHLVPPARRNRLVFIDERGSGKSAKLERSAEYTVENMVEDVEAVRQSLRLGKISLVGHSCGGVLAQAYALKRTEPIVGALSIVLIYLDRRPGQPSAQASASSSCVPCRCLVKSRWSLPDALAVPVNLADAVERNPPQLPGLIRHFKDATLAFREHDRLECHPAECTLPAIEVADFKLAAAKFLIPTDACQQFVDGLHGGYSRSGNCSRVSRNLTERAWPGTRSMNPRFVRVTIICWVAGGEVWKYRWMSASAGATP
jgi:pimeloyl-ACP methyl ester carboxylesterase